MFRSVGNDRNNDEGDPFLVDRRMLYETIDAVNEIIGSEIGDDRNGDEKEQSGKSVHAGIFDIVWGGSTCVGLDGGGMMDVSHAHGQDISGGQMGLNRCMNGLETGPRARSGSRGARRSRRAGGR